METLTNQCDAQRPPSPFVTLETGEPWYPPGDTAADCPDGNVTWIEESGWKAVMDSDGHVVVTRYRNGAQLACGKGKGKGRGKKR